MNIASLDSDNIRRFRAKWALHNGGILIDDLEQWLARWWEPPREWQHAPRLAPQAAELLSQLDPRNLADVAIGRLGEELKECPTIQQIGPDFLALEFIVAPGSQHYKSWVLLVLVPEMRAAFPELGRRIE